MIGTNVAHYKIIEKLGEGGMGEVYLAEDSHLLRNVAIKILPHDLLRDKEYQWRFIKEAQTASSLNHPNICTIHDINEIEKISFIVMEYVEGKTLRQIIDERGPLKEQEVIKFTSKICDALTAVHSKGILHRDIKPENIMITDSGFLKVMDFGLAKLATESAEHVAAIKDKTNNMKISSSTKYSQDVVLDTLSGLLGTVAYMSPDQALGKEIDQRSDIFSLGVVIYEMLSNVRPFSGDTNETIIYNIFSEPYKPLEIEKNNISSEMINIIDRCLEKIPENRYSSVSRLQLDLLSIKDESKTTIEKVISDDITNKYKEQERRNVSILIAEISNYKSMLTNVDPEDASNSINQFYDMFTSVVEKYCGRIDKIFEGTVQVIFGAPVASENSQKEAVNTAIEIRNNLKELNQNQRAKIELKIGINSGTVLAGMVGKDEHMNYSIFGEPVNYAANLKDLCKENQILVGALTHKLTRKEFKYNELPPIFIKGADTKSIVFELISEKEIIHRPKLGFERQIYSEMVGRSKELNIIKSHLGKLIEGNGFIISIIGEAGIGKSRLKAEVRDLDIISKFTFLEGRSLSIGKNLSFHPLIDIMKNWAGIKDDDAEQDWHHKLENLIIDIYPQNAEEIFPFIATLMSIELKGKHAERIAGIIGLALEKLILKNLREFLAYTSAQKPIVFVMEDLHWADATSIEFLEMLFRLVRNNRILFINIFRPNYKDTTDEILDYLHNNYSDSHRGIILKSLDEAEGIQLINNLLKIERLESKTIDMINRKSGGNPFFIEEVIRSFIDEGAIINKNDKFIATSKIESIVVPETISEVIISRIDRLDEGTKALLKKASVIGRNFFHKIIGEVASIIEDLDERLAYLKDIQLIKEHTRLDEIEYLFKHALAHEAVYESILIKKRRELHIKTAKTIENIFSDRLSQFYGILSYHYIKGEDLDTAEEYLIKAGEEALKSSASNEAIEYFKDALNIYLDKYGSATDPKKKAMLEYNIAMALQNKGRLSESVEYFDRVQIYYKLNLPKNQLLVLIKVIKGFGNLLVGIYFPFLKWKKIPNANENELESFSLNFNNSVALVNPKRGFIVLLYNLTRITKIDISYSETFRINLCGAAGIISYVGISSSVHRKILDLIREKRNKNNAKEEIMFKMSQQMYKWTWGHWKISSENDYDENLVDSALKIGEAQNATLYMNQCILTKIERGHFTDVEMLLNKMVEMGDIYENNFPREVNYVSRTKFLMKKRLLNEALKEDEKGIKFNVKTNYLEFLFEFLSFKPRVELLIGDVDKAEKSLKYALTFKSKNFTPWALTDFLTSQFLFDIYHLEKAIEAGNKSDISKCEKITFRSGKEAYKNSKKFAGDRIEIYRLMGRYYWLLNKQKKAIKWWDKSIQFGEKSGGKLELARTFMEVGKRLIEEKSNFNELNGITAKEYLKKAKIMFEEMDLQWDLEELEKIK